MLKVSVEDSIEAVVLHCQGRLVKGEETALMCAAARRHGKNIVLDLTEVVAIDAAGIGALITLQAAGIYLKLMNPTKPLREILKVTKLESLFEIGESALGPAAAMPTEIEAVVA